MLSADANTNPFRIYPYGGYQLLASADTYGEMWSIVQPGATGAGLHIGTVEHICCNRYGWEKMYNVMPDQHGRIWRQPAYVEYMSILNPKTMMPADDIADMYPDLIGPHVAVTRAQTMQGTGNWGYTNMYKSEEMLETGDPYGFVSGWYETSLGPIAGLLPAWEIVPISTNNIEHVQMALDATPFDVNPLDACTCCLEDYGDHVARDPKTGLPLNEQDKDKCEYQLGQTYCSCGEPPTQQQVYEEFWYTAPCLYQHDPLLLNLCEYGTEKSTSGWQALYDAVSTTTNYLEATCFTYYWRSYSPFADSPGLVLPALQP